MRAAMWRGGGGGSNEEAAAVIGYRAGELVGMVRSRRAPEGGARGDAAYAGSARVLPGRGASTWLDSHRRSAPEGGAREAGSRWQAPPGHLL